MCEVEFFWEVCCLNKVQGFFIDGNPRSIADCQIADLADSYYLDPDC